MMSISSICIYFVFQFLDFIKIHLKKTPELLEVIKKKHHASSERFRSSQEFEHLLSTTHSKIENDTKNVFVHLRSFVNELKAYKKKKKEQNRHKRKRDDLDLNDCPSPKSLKSSSAEQSEESDGGENNEAFIMAMNGPATNKSDVRLSGKFI